MTDALVWADQLPDSSSTSVTVLKRAELQGCPGWVGSFASERKDYRYYEIVEDTLREGYDYRYFAVVDRDRGVDAVQPFFLLDQDIFEGVDPRTRAVIARMRRLWPRLGMVRTLMVGSPAGEAHLQSRIERSHHRHAEVLAATIVAQARALNASLVVLKEFPARYRAVLGCFVNRGFTRVPSMPMTRLDIRYRDFDDYMHRALNSATRRKLRKKFRATDAGPAIEMTVTTDITAVIDEIYPLYLQVYDRSTHHFEKLTRSYFCRLGQRMPDKVRFFLWRRDGRIVAFCLCMVEGDSFYAEYVGFDYAVALDLHLYHYVVRDMINWAIANGYAWFRSSALNYDPKLHLRHQLDPIDLYVRHTSWIGNAVLRRVLPLLAPVRYDRTLPKFSNYADLW